MWRFILAGLLLVHGLIHALGFVWAWDVAEVEGLGGPTVLLSDLRPGGPAIMAFGLLWLIAMVAFVGAAAGAVSRQSWWPRLAGVAAGISLVPTIVWWNDAVFGALVSLTILLGVMVAQRRAGDRPRGPHDGRLLAHR